MKKLEKRAILCLLCAAVLVIGLGIFIAEFAVKGSTWASYPANQHIYKDGNLTTGTIYDVNGTKLAENTKDGAYGRRPKQKHQQLCRKRISEQAGGIQYNYGGL